MIPEGQYGGGTVMVWDRGTYYVYGEQPLKSLREGKLHLLLDGKKAKGEWTLVRIRGRDGEKNQWLILKTGDDVKPISSKLDDESVKTGRTMKQIADARDAEWQSGRAEDQSPTSQFKARIREAIKKVKDEPVGQAHSRAVASAKAGRLPIAKQGTQRGRPTIPSIAKLPSGKPRFVEPMKAKLVEKPPATGDWIYELKFDGIRLIAIKDRGKVSLLSRNQNDLSARFPEIVDAVKNLPADECVLDGEVVALDEEGRSSFQLLQAREMEGRKSPIYFYAFDLLQLDGKSLVSLPLEARKNVLEKLCAGAGDPGFDTPARLVEMPTSSSRKCNAAAWKESSANYTTPFTNPAGEAAHGSNSNVSTNRNSSLADTPRRKGHANISAQFSSATTRIAISYSPVRSAPDLQRNHWPHCTRNSAPRNVPTVRLSICHQSKTANGCWASHLR